MYTPWIAPLLAPSPCFAPWILHTHPQALSAIARDAAQAHSHPCSHPHPQALSAFLRDTLIAARALRGRGALVEGAEGSVSGGAHRQWLAFGLELGNAGLSEAEEEVATH